MLQIRKNRALPCSQYLHHRIVQSWWANSEILLRLILFTPERYWKLSTRSPRWHLHPIKTPTQTSTERPHIPTQTSSNNHLSDDFVTTYVTAYHSYVPKRKVSQIISIERKSNGISKPVERLAPLVESWLESHSLHYTKSLSYCFYCQVQSGQMNRKSYKTKNKNYAEIK